MQKHIGQKPIEVSIYTKSWANLADPSCKSSRNKETAQLGVSEILMHWRCPSCLCDDMFENCPLQRTTHPVNTNQKRCQVACLTPTWPLTLAMLLSASSRAPSLGCLRSQRLHCEWRYHSRSAPTVPWGSDQFSLFVAPVLQEWNGQLWPKISGERFAQI